MNIKSEGYQHLNVPNTPEGIAFIKQLRTYLNKSTHSIKCRGRGSRPNRRYQGYLPIPMAKWLAVYFGLSKKATDKKSEIDSRDWAEKRKQYDEIKTFKDQIESLKNELFISQKRIRVLTEQTIPTPAAPPIQLKQVSQPQQFTLPNNKQIVIKISVE